MGDGIYVALSGAVAQTAALETTANNLANVGTTGFQKSNTVFREALSQASGEQLHFVSSNDAVLSDEPGARRATGRALDMALPKGTYLPLQAGGGTRYTRDGSLSMGADGTIVSRNGIAVLGENGEPLQAQPSGGPVQLLSDGSVVQGETTVGRLGVVEIHASDLVHEGGTLLALRPNAPAPVPSSALIETNVVEESNVSAISGMTELVSANRTFEAFQKAIDAFREADRAIVTRVPNLP